MWSTTKTAAGSSGGSVGTSALSASTPPADAPTTTMSRWSAGPLRPPLESGVYPAFSLRAARHALIIHRRGCPAHLGGLKVGAMSLAISHPNSVIWGILPRVGAARMHQTTIRFSTELWAELEREAAAEGVSAAHYVRDAALARLSYSAGLGARKRSPSPSVVVPERAQDAHEGSAAVWAQAQQARRRAQDARAATRRVQAGAARHASDQRVEGS